jgi:hypothetical protein
MRQDVKWKSSWFGGEKELIGEEEKEKLLRQRQTLEALIKAIYLALQVTLAKK